MKILTALILIALTVAMIALATLQADNAAHDGMAWEYGATRTPQAVNPSLLLPWQS